jgi:hypothetical protein
MQCLARLLLVFACLLLGPLAVTADELPADTNKIESLSAEQARKLVETFKRDQLYLNGVTTLDTDTAKALAEFKGRWLLLNVLTTLDADTAKALAEFKGQGLSLIGLTTLDADTAKALAEFKGQWLNLNGLTTLDAETAKALAEFKGPGLYLADKAKNAFFKQNPLSVETALVWAAVSGGNLTAITAFDTPDSVAIAQALATRKGPLALPNLKKISPKTLTALIEKRDVQIPPIETLDLIPEPDGSVTEDFVIPKWLESR